MSAIFLSYRRGDAQGTTGRIFDWLEKHYGGDEVFMDADDIPLGVDFRKHIERHIERAEVLLAIVGPKWNELGENGRRRRLSSKRDWVRIEIQLALAAQVAVVPLFVDGADLPIPGGLPKALRDLAFHQAEHIDAGRDFPHHFKRLVTKLDKLIERRRAERLRIPKVAEAVKSPPALVSTPPKPPVSMPLQPAPATPRVAITKPSKPATKEKTDHCVVSVAADLANQLASIGRGKG